MAPSRALMIQRYVCAHFTKHAVPRRSYVATASLLSTQERLPRIANPSFWSSLIPSFLRRPTTEEEAAERARKRANGSEERRTGIVFLVLGILVGSNAINIISLRRDMLNFSRETDAKLETLREVVRRVKNGEDFDVKKALGTGDPDQEKEWEQVVKELEETDLLWESKKKHDAKLAKRAEKQRLKDEARTRMEATDEAPKKPVPKFLM